MNSRIVSIELSHSLASKGSEDPTNSRLHLAESFVYWLLPAVLVYWLCHLVGNLQEINLLWSDQDVIPIVQPITNALRHVIDDSSFLNDDDEVELYDEDDESVADYVDEETDAENDIDTEENDDDHSYHANDSN